MSDNSLVAGSHICNIILLLPRSLDSNLIRTKKKGSSGINFNPFILDVQQERIMRSNG